MMDYLIRKAEITDSATVVSLIKELADTIGEHSNVTEEYVVKYLAYSSGEIFLAEKQGKVLGLLSYSFRPDLYHAGRSCLIEELIVRQANRGQGIGGRLVDELITRLALTDCAEISVSTLPESKDAIQFYQDHGFSVEGVLLELHFPKKGARR